MSRFASSTLLRVALLGFLLLPLSCESDSLPQEEAELEEGDFFDSQRLLDGAVDLGDEAARVTCVGATEEEQSQTFHPRILRGVVLAPASALAMVPDYSRSSPSETPSLLERFFISKAHAAPLEGESLVMEQRVFLTRVDETGEPVGEVLLETKTTVLGEFCFRLPDDLEYGPTLMVIAESETHRLRRPLLHQNDIDIYSQPEALVRLLVEEGFLLTDLDVDTYLNLDVMAQTAVDLLNPVTVDTNAGLDSLLARLDRRMREDERLMEALERVRAALESQPQ